MKNIEKNKPNTEFGVALEESASTLTQGYVHGLRYEGWNQRYP